MAKNQPWIQRYPSEELAGAQLALTCEEAGALQRFRDFSFYNGGIPANEKFLLSLARSFQLSRYKFRKIWPVLENFFEITDAVFHFPADEEKRSQRLVLLAKRQISGKKGAESRWGKVLDGCSQSGDIVIANQMANAIPFAMAEPEPELEPDTSTGEPPPPPTPSASMAGGGGAPNPTNALTQNLPEPVYRAICQKTIDLGMAIPSRKLAQKIWEKFPGRPIDAVVQSLVRWEGQLHAGLWGEKTLQDFELECFRQANGGRKPSASDQRARHVYEVGMEALARKRTQNA
jgi:hypothetical protein